MKSLAFVRKELQEHGVALLALIFAVVCALLITLSRFRNEEFSVSPLEVLSYSLYTFIPLAAFILGNRLIVRDYSSRAQQFTESLPVRRSVPLIVKYFLGAVVVVGLMMTTLLIASRYASVVDSITPAYFALLATKTASIALLFWSIAFALSLSGHLRLILYVLLIALVYYLVSTASVDATDFGPFALMMDETLVYERTEVPYRALIETWLLTLVFTAAGFIIALWHEGSMAEVLSRPMARRDYLLAGFIIAGFATIMSILDEEPLPQPARLGGQFSLYADDHDITVKYLAGENEAAAQLLLDGLVNDLNSVQERIGPVALRPAYIVHEDSLESWEFIADSADGPLVYGNFYEAAHYDRVVFRTTVLHQLLLARSGGRAVFEHYHWFLDGYTRLITESSTAATNADEQQANHDELLARALISAQQLGEVKLIEQWQLVADQMGYASAEALAYSALKYLQTLKEDEVIDALAVHWLADTAERDSRATFNRWRRDAERDFNALTGLDWNTFSADWRNWLSNQATRPAVAELVGSVRYRAARADIINTETEDQLLVARFAADEVTLPKLSAVELPERSPSLIDFSSSSESALPDTVCILNHRRSSPFDTEMDFIFEYFEELPCDGAPITISAYNINGSGDRVYITTELRTSSFHQPIRLGADRITSP